MEMTAYGTEARLEARIAKIEDMKQWDADAAAFHSLFGAMIFIPAALYMIGFCILIPLSVIWGIRALANNTQYRLMAYLGMGISFYYAAMGLCYMCSVC